MSGDLVSGLHAFVIRVWREWDDEVGSFTTCRGVIVDAMSGKRIGFNDLQRIVDFIGDETGIYGDRYRPGTVEDLEE